MDWIEASCPLLELEGIGPNACAIVANAPVVPDHFSTKLQSGNVAYAIEGDCIKVQLFKKLDNALDKEIFVHCGYSRFDSMDSWDTPGVDIRMNQRGDKDGVFEAQIPIDLSYGCLLFVIKDGSDWIKDAGGSNFRVPFHWRSESIAIEDGILSIFVFSRRIGMKWLTMPSDHTPSYVRCGVAYAKVGEWSEGSSFEMKFSSDGEAETELPPGAMGMSFLLRTANGEWLKDENDKNFYVHSRARDDCEVEAYHEMPIRLDVSVERIMQLYRRNPFWVYPQPIGTTQEISPECLFFTAELEDGRFLTAVAMADPKRNARASFRGWTSGIILRIEASDIPYQDSSVVAGVAIGSSLETSARLANQIAAEMLGNRPRRDAHEDGALSRIGIGWCSWDSLGQEVNAETVVQSVSNLIQKGIPLRWVIIDDGWQDIDDTRKLLGNGTNEKFGDMKKVIKTLKEDLGIRKVLVWHTLIGYWQGLSENGSLAESAGVQKWEARFGAGLYQNDRNEMVNNWKKEYHVPLDPVSFFNTYYASLRELGVDGTKVDAQGLLEGFGGREHSRIAQMSKFRRAMEEAAEKEFEGAVINCMACGNDAVFCAGQGPSSLIWRSSDDHAYHHVEEDSHAVARHIWANAANCLWLGEHFIPDWDMFRASKSHCNVHAAARAISGGPIYVSDGPNDDPATESMLRLVDDEGNPLTCGGSGKICQRSIFDDPLNSGRAFYIWNENSINSVVGAFNLNVKSGSSVVADLAPVDSGVVKMKCSNEKVQFAVYGLHSGFVGVANLLENIEVMDLSRPLDFEIFTVAPIFDLECGARVSLFGLEGKFNGGAAVLSVDVTENEIEFSLTSTGRYVFWSDSVPKLRSSGDQPIPIDKHADKNLFTADVISGSTLSLALLFE